MFNFSRASAPQNHQNAPGNLKMDKTWHASVRQHQFCPSVSDSWCGWQPVQAGSDEEYVHHNIMQEAAFEVIKPTYISLTNKALLQRCLRGATQSQNEAFYAVIWNMLPKQGFVGAEAVGRSAHLAATRFNHGSFTFLAVLRKMGRTTRIIYRILCAARRCLKSQEGWSQGWREAKIQEKKLWEREGKFLRRKQWKQRAEPMNPVPFDHNFSEWRVFLKLKLCAFWRSATHSVHDNFLTVHCEKYVFEVCEVIASAWMASIH